MTKPLSVRDIMLRSKWNLEFIWEVERKFGDRERDSDEVIRLVVERHRDDEGWRTLISDGVFKRQTISVVEQHRDREPGPYEVTQLVNSFLGALAHPWEALRSDLNRLPLSEAKHRGWPIPQEQQGEDPQTLGRLLNLIRNAFAHGNIEFLPDRNNEIERVRFWNWDDKRRCRTWRACLGVDELRRFLTCFIDLAKELSDRNTTTSDARPGFDSPSCSCCGHQVLPSELEPNHFELSGPGVHILLSADTTTGNPRLRYQEDTQRWRSFSGREIDVCHSRLGQQVTVTLERVRNSYRRTLTALIPEMGLASAGQATYFTTQAIYTTHITSGPGPSPTPQALQAYRALELKGIASLVR